MSMALTPDIEADIRRWLGSGRYPDADAVVRAALRAQREHDEARPATVRDLVVAGCESGPGEVLTDELRDEIAREADEAGRLGLKIRREVQP